MTRSDKKLNWLVLIVTFLLLMGLVHESFAQKRIKEPSETESLYEHQKYESEQSNDPEPIESTGNPVSQQDNSKQPEPSKEFPFSTVVTETSDPSLQPSPAKPTSLSQPKSIDEPHIHEPKPVESKPVESYKPKKPEPPQNFPDQIGPTQEQSSPMVVEPDLASHPKNPALSEPSPQSIEGKIEPPKPVIEVLPPIILTDPSSSPRSHISLPISELDAVDGEILVILRDNPDSENNIEYLRTAYNMGADQVFRLLSIGVVVAKYRSPDPNILKKLNSDPRVLFAQYNYIYRLAGETIQYGLRKIRADLAHQFVTGKGVKVAVIDTGVDYNHKVLSDKIVLKANYVDSNDGAFIQDLHGTLIAGIIAATAEAGAGIIGIAPDVRIMAIKACWSDTKDFKGSNCSSDRLARAVDFAIRNRANVINLSLGGPREELLTTLIKRAFDYGIIVVAAAGNGGSKGKPVFPAALDEVIAVSATDSDDRLYELSTRGDYINLAAPGVDIFSSAPGDKWHISSGTSMAAAHVSGVAALILQKRPELSPFEVKTLLGFTAVDLGKRGKDKEFGEGRIDAFQALQKLMGDMEARR